MLTNIENKSDFVVNLAQHSKGGISHLPIDTLDIRCEESMLWFYYEGHQTPDELDYFEEKVCVDPTELVWSCFYNGERSILTCICGEDICAGFVSQYAYCIAGYVYWLIMVKEGDVLVFRYSLEDYRQKVKDVIHELITAMQNPKEDDYITFWYPDSEELIDLFQVFVREQNLQSIYQNDERMMRRLFAKYGKDTNDHIICPSYVRTEPKSEPCLYLMIGIPASGKSTFCRLNFPYADVISLDRVKTRNNEQLLIDDALWQRADIIIDNTNVTRAERARYIGLAKRRGYRVVGYYFQSILSDCIRRNQDREGKARVPDKAIVAKSNQLELPSRSEGFDELYFVKMEDGHFNTSEWKED